MTLVKQNAIDYYDLGKKSSDTVVFIFPQAGEKIKDIEIFLKIISKKHRVIFLSKGYFGISKLKSVKDVAKYSFGNALHTLSKKVLKDLKGKRVVTIGISIGSLHAIEFSIKNNLKDLILISPAIYKKSKFSRLHRLLLKFTLLYDDFFQSNTFKLIYTLSFHNPTLSDMKQVSKKVGSISYLRCLKDIVDYPTPTIKIQSILTNSLVIVGNKDPFYKRLVNTHICEFSNLIYVNSGHSPTSETPNMVAREVLHYIEKK